MLTTISAEGGPLRDPLFSELSDVTFVADASGGVSAAAHEMGVQRMIQAGARPMTWQAVMADLCPDGTSAEYQRLYPVAARHGQGVSYAVQYVIANLARD